jgi:hypothetical protein
MLKISAIAIVPEFTGPVPVVLPETATFAEFVVPETPAPLAEFGVPAPPTKLGVPAPAASPVLGAALPAAPSARGIL